jgi:hypothetical protein
VLTNRHVAAADDEVAVEGFRLRLPPDFKQGPLARVAWLCQDYDLAILEAAEDLKFSELVILDAVAPLGTKITAYGFPLGELFGVGLTANGGQITRHPANDSEPVLPIDEIKDISKSLWHDAQMAEGSSGGPLSTEHGVLVGLQFAGVEDHGFAVPSDAIARLLRTTATTRNVKLISPSALATARGDYDMKQITVYVEILGKESEAPAEDPNDSLADDQPFTPEEQEKIEHAIEMTVRNALPRLTDAEFKQMCKGDITPAFAPSPVALMKKGDVIRIKSKMTILQIVEEGVLVSIDNVRCLMCKPKFNSSEARAKLGTPPIPNVPVDEAFVVGEPTDYANERGSTESCIPLLSAWRAMDQLKLRNLLLAEVDRRNALVAEQIAAERAEIRKRLQRTLTSPSGRSSLEAIVVAINGPEKTIDVIRVSDNGLFKLELSRVSESDRKWIIRNRELIKKHGKSIVADLAKSDKKK